MDNVVRVRVIETLTSLAHNVLQVPDGKTFFAGQHGGESITWELTPLLGGAWGTKQAFVPGLEASMSGVEAARSLRRS